MRGNLKLLYQPYKWLFLFPFVALCTLILGSMCIIASFLVSVEATNIFAVIWAKIACSLVPLKVNFIGKENFSEKKSYVIVANHQSMVDIIIFHAYLGLKIKWIMKKELEDVPFFGYACKKLGCIYVDRSNHTSAIAAMRQAEKNLAETSSVIFFPEGTRSRDGKLLDFKKGAFHFALATGLPILPVTIKGSGDILPALSYDVTPGLATLVAHPAIEMKNRQIEDIDKILALTKKLIADAL